MGGIGNCGVIYFNVAAYTAVFPQMMAWAGKQAFKFPIVDQSLLLDFFGNRFNALPDVYNWCVVWRGRPVSLLLVLSRGGRA